MLHLVLSLTPVLHKMLHKIWNTSRREEASTMANDPDARYWLRLYAGTQTLHVKLRMSI